ncbi:T-cell receptor alpha chain C region [Oryzias melastigma]|nr:T-cell receptor alpha chain C region [Oryzias melastigma]
MSGAQKMLFGSGVGLSVEATNDVKPNFYHLKNPNEAEHDVCLATSFTRYYDVMKANLLDGFNKTKPTMITGSNGVYNQVAFLDKNGTETCRALSTDEPSSPKPDPVVNLASLTIFGLRVIFFKTVVFNVLMTLRLWSSQLRMAVMLLFQQAVPYMMAYVTTQSQKVLRPQEGLLQPDGQQPPQQEQSV